MNIKQYKLQIKYEELFQYKKNIDEMIELPEHSALFISQNWITYLNDFISLLCEEGVYFKFDQNGRTYELENKNVEDNKRYAQIVEVFPDGTKEFWIEGRVDDLLAKYLRGELFLYEH